ncbi:NfeD family protein [Pelagovum pacificum]|uniref:NfeD family protein n=1 Tax=Pelagovum pacificum TaxID=2588711 RepID=A0A5C5GJ68_9RHOB|nr:hypothetical protein [Pelagovum pacificum]QQA42595.1 hypothetical protein I8N54_17720 [Pelagovum pacificum]TNY34254.1 hypothetical protein FHY64_13670 [Pelagovum pacificum]
MIWESWWAWVVGGLVLGILEMLIPAYIFLGFGGGAVVTGLLVAVGLLRTLPWMLVVFALLSIASTFVLRRSLGSSVGKAKVWKTDINDN